MTKPQVKLSNSDGNAFMVIGAANKAIARFNREQTDPSKMVDKDEFQKEATSGDYDHVIQTVMKYCDVI